MAGSKLIHLISIAAPFRYGVEDMTRPPSGILYVGSLLKQHGFDVHVHHVKEDDSEELIEDIRKDDAVFIGFSVMTGVQVSASANLSFELKRTLPDTPIIWGGIHPSLMPAETLKFDSIDFVVIGEGENTALELAQYLSGRKTPKLNQIRGLAFKNNEGGIVTTPPRPFEKGLDKFNQDWSLIDKNRYIKVLNSERVFYFITSRGCPHSCGFCYNQAFNRKRWRAHSVEFVVGQLFEIKKETGISHVIFDDDNFFTNQKRGIEILKRIKEIGLTCKWVDLRIDYVEEALISQLAELGVSSIFLGWESGCDTTLKRISKGFDSRLILEKMEILAKYPQLAVDASAIVGFPWEDEKNMKKTVSLALKMFHLKPFLLNFNIGIYVPYPGSPILSEALEHGFSFPAESEGWRKFDILSGDMELPWLDKDIIDKYTLIDRYAKLLYVIPKQKRWKTSIAYTLACLAYFRLRLQLLYFPFEIWLSDWYRKKMMRHAS